MCKGLGTVPRVPDLPCEFAVHANVQQALIAALASDQRANVAEMKQLLI